MTEGAAAAPATPSSTAPDVLAAVDLGSNSFHLVVAQVTDGHLDVIDRLRETVRLAAGLDEDRRLSGDAIGAALACLERFGQRVRGIPAHAVRAVGTNTLRGARNGEAFRLAAQSALGHRIEVIAGREEARLVYLGVAHSLAGERARRLVIDIGGGSTELIVGEGFSSLYRESLYMGCVGMSRRFFPDGRIDKAAMKRAELAARVELEPIEARFRAASWSSAVGSSGTVRSIAAIANASGWCEHGFSRAALRKLRRALIDAGGVDALKLEGLKDERRPVLPGGVAILSAACDALGIEQLEVSDMALREGLLYDLLGRFRHEDVRDRTVGRLCERFAVDADQAARVEATAASILGQSAAPWGSEDDERMLALRWAARLHEVGLAISHNQYHKHGAYVIANADMAGFSRQEQALLAALVRGHRRKLPQSVFDALPDAAAARRLCVALRVAVVLHRARIADALPAFDARVDGDAARLAFPSGWLDAHPLTRADLAQEADYLRAAGVALELE